MERDVRRLEKPTAHSSKAVENDSKAHSGGPSSKPMTDFEEMALSTFGSVAVDGMQNVQSLGLTPIEQTDECAISSPTGSPQQLCSQVDASPNPEHLTASPLTPSTYLSLENQDASTVVLSRSARNKLISALKLIYQNGMLLRKRGDGSIVK
ncbi:uncharacterized protein LOC120779577 [Bactrocera tryoni]|uniref:uncharacterized protein LOC120779577 n=1 Tax=Bactrocera tryoni TaxID=59916 RepID=UPI001A95FEBA|nr:uncharacterized protein LOC120779577 [Bactrocera tryoni]